MVIGYQKSNKNLTYAQLVFKIVVGWVVAEVSKHVSQNNPGHRKEPDAI